MHQGIKKTIKALGLIVLSAVLLFRASMPVSDFVRVGRMVSGYLYVVMDRVPFFLPLRSFFA
ncbi:Uncharacterised protein [Chlamydia abortus]|uniref:hypothetical protein n=1 Tax=Paenibacillus sp. SAFN-117 TaxID=3436860 RepID=UPI000A27EAEB|nr:Uncharacterised protein [Chlamydia abortus]